MGERTLKKFDVILESKINKLVLLTGKIMKTLKINLSNLKLIRGEFKFFLPSLSQLNTTKQFTAFFTTKNGNTYDTKCFRRISSETSLDSVRDESYCTTNQGSYEYIIRAILSFFQSTNLYRMNKTLPQNQIYNM